MSIMVKDIGGVEQSVASSAKGNAALSLGIIGTALGALGGNFLGGNAGGLLGGTGTNDCLVNQREFFNYQLADQREMYTNLMSVGDRICSLESRVAGDEISISKNFEIENMRSNYENQLMKAYIQAATCDFVKANHYLSPSQLADPYKGSSNYIATYNGYCGGGYCGGGFEGGCGCGGY